MTQPPASAEMKKCVLCGESGKAAQRVACYRTITGIHLFKANPATAPFPADEKGREEMPDPFRDADRHAKRISGAKTSEVYFTARDILWADLAGRNDALDAMRRQRDEAIALLRELDADPHATITLSLKERNAAFLAKVKP